MLCYIGRPRVWQGCIIHCPEISWHQSHLETRCHVCLGKNFGRSSYASSCCICMLNGTPCGLTYSNAVETMCSLGWSNSNSLRACCVIACKCLSLEVMTGTNALDIHKLAHRTGPHRLVSRGANGVSVTLEVNVAGLTWLYLIASLHLLWVRTKVNAHVGYMHIIE